MASATDGIHSAALSLARGDFGGYFVEVRRVEEMHLLAVALGFDPTLAQRWLGGEELKPGALRKGIAEHNSAIAENFRTSYDFLSTEAHGRSRSLGSFANSGGRFSWPPHAEDVDLSHMASAHAHLCSIVLLHFGLIRRMAQGWDEFDAALGAKAAESFYAAIQAYGLEVAERREWWLLDQSEIRPWLRKDLGVSWERRQAGDESAQSSAAIVPRERGRQTPCRRDVSVARRNTCAQPEGSVPQDRTLHDCRITTD